MQLTEGTESLRQVRTAIKRLDRVVQTMERDMEAIHQQHHHHHLEGLNPHCMEVNFVPNSVAKALKVASDTFSKTWDEVNYYIHKGDLQKNPPTQVADDKTFSSDNQRTLKEVADSIKQLNSDITITDRDIATDKVKASSYGKNVTDGIIVTEKDQTNLKAESKSHSDKKNELERRLQLEKTELEKILSGIRAFEKENKKRDQTKKPNQQ